MSSAPSGWRIGSLSGIPVYLGRSWVLVALLMVALFGPTVQRAVPETGVWGYAVALVFALLLLVSVLVHEAAHALMAQRVGFRVSRMVADFWGGHTAHDGAGGTPGRSAAVAVVGPLSNGVLAALGWVLVDAIPAGGVTWVLAFAFAWANTFVTLFNLVPGLPLDGGFLLEAAVWKVSGSRHLGTMVAGWAGRLVVVLVAIWALSPVLQGQQISLMRVVWVLLIGAFLWQGASQAIAVGRHGAIASRRTAKDVALSPGVVGHDTPLAQVSWDQHPIWVVLGADGRPDGVVHPPSLDQVPTPERAVTPASAVAVRLPAGWAVPIPPETRLDEVIEVMRSSGSGIVGLLGADGRPWGVVVADAVTRGRS